jgi:FtsH-binding integral membrane protein
MKKIYLMNLGFLFIAFIANLFFWISMKHPAEIFSNNVDRLVSPEFPKLYFHLTSNVQAIVLDFTPLVLVLAFIINFFLMIKPKKFK